MKENTLMKKLLDEMEKRNKLLEEKILTLESNSLSNQTTVFKSYSNAVTNLNLDRKNVSPIIIKPNVKSDDFYNEIKSQINVSNLKIAVNSLKKRSDGSIQVKCSNSKDGELLKTELDKIFIDKSTINRPSLNKPRLKIIGVENDFDLEEVSAALKNQNSIECETNDFKVLHIHKLKNKDSKTIYLETSPIIFQRLLARKKVFIGWQRCRIYEDLNINRCFNCNGYGHSAKNCKNGTTCAHCSGDHNTNSCTNKNVAKCINCIRANAKFKLNRNIDHQAFDEKCCESYDFYKKIIVSRIEY